MKTAFRETNVRSMKTLICTQDSPNEFQPWADLKQLMLKTGGILQFIYPISENVHANLVSLGNQKNLGILSIF